MKRFLLRFAVVAGAVALVKKALDSRSSPAPAAPAPAAAPEPGPSVTPPAQPASETPRADDDPFVAEEEAAAAAEAGAIGGPRLHDADDPAFEAAYEAGEGEAEGFEAAERELEDNATHGGGRGDPLRDAITPEVEADESTALDAEADRILEADDDRRDE